MHYTIYKITNKVNGKVYIGKHMTDRLEDGYFGSGKLLIKAIKKHGKENFVKEILFTFETETEMNAKETELVTEYFCKRSDTYNLCVGGLGGFGFINQRGMNNANKDMVTINEKIRAKSLGRKNPSLTKRMIAWHKQGKVRHDTFSGRRHTEDTRIKMSLSAKGKHTGTKNSQYGTVWITDGSENRKVQSADAIPFGWKKGRSVMSRSSSQV